MMSLSDEDCPFSEEERRAKASFIDVLSPNLSQIGNLSICPQM
jgi:hypothetical protein